MCKAQNLTRPKRKSWAKAWSCPNWTSILLSPTHIYCSAHAWPWIRTLETSPGVPPAPNEINLQRLWAFLDPAFGWSMPLLSMSDLSAFKWSHYVPLVGRKASWDPSGWNSACCRSSTLTGPSVRFCLAFRSAASCSVWWGNGHQECAEKMLNGSKPILLGNIEEI